MEKDAFEKELEWRWPLIMEPLCQEYGCRFEFAPKNRIYNADAYDEEHGRILYSSFYEKYWRNSVDQSVEDFINGFARNMSRNMFNTAVKILECSISQDYPSEYTIHVSGFSIIE